jgi:AraC family transcriptional regulator, regulatory protein of adaptative response / methylated-DNA-[protein]-cysteine methyltransferase
MTFANDVCGVSSAGLGTLHVAVQPCWLGQMLVAVSQRGICAVLLGDDSEALTSDLRRRFQAAELLPSDDASAQRIADVLAHAWTPTLPLTVPLDLRGTSFQQQVWQALCRVPFGTTTSYAAIARQIGRPEASRAVGQAIGANPVAIAVPCHRVVRSDGSLSGYRWGAERKTRLLDREQQLLLCR